MKTRLPFTNRRVLVVDDNPTIHEDFRKILSGSSPANSQLEDLESAFFDAAPSSEAPEGFELDSAFQGQEGLAKVEQAMQAGRPYALAFLDMRMPPGWDGVETLARLWKVDPNLQVVICTAYSDYSWDDILRQLGNRSNLAVLKKPFDNIEVIQLCETLTHKWALSQLLNPPEPLEAEEPPPLQPPAARSSDGS